MNNENYKKDRNKPKRDGSISRSKKQLLVKPNMLNSAGTPKLSAIYRSKTAWLTKTIPKLKEN